jgi:hypothetical protein
VASAVRVLLQEEECATTSLNLAETIDVCCRVHRIPARDVDKALEPLLDEQLLVLAPGIEDARRAALIRATHFRPRRCELSLADCFLLAAPTRDDELATTDPAVLAVAKAIRIHTVEVG